jgi:hypothetical protein
VVLEIDRFNLELNLTPAPLAGRPFAAMASELDQALGIVRRAAAWHGGRIVMVGILPALGSGDLELAADDVGLEGANTSFQVHLRVDPDRFADCFNAAQLATGPVLAAAANSPTLLGHRLWQETRVALFKQAVDDRDASGRSSRRMSRVAFGTGWVRTGALELLEESVRLHEPVLPVLGPERPLERLDGDGVPALNELRLHQGTVWRWNRAIYDPAGGGHLRIELRALPSGPTVVDMLANAAFLLGLTLALAADAGTVIRRFAFQQAHHNFYRAAQFGLGAELAWPLHPGGRARTLPAAELVRQLLPAARRGLVEAGVVAEEAKELLAVVQARTASGQTGAVWQRDALAALEPRLGRDRALAAMLEHYLELQQAGDPVHTWPLPQAQQPAPQRAVRDALHLLAMHPLGEEDRHDVPYREHAGRCALLQHHQVPDAPVVHLGRGDVHVPVGRGGHHRGGHVVGDPDLPNVTEPGGGVHHVTLGEDAGDLAALLHDHRADAVLGHDLGGLLQRLVGVDGDHRAPHEVTDLHG